MDIVYATRNDITNTMSIPPTTHNKLLVDNKLRAASRSVEGRLHNRFYPELKTVKFDWPNSQYAGTGRIWLDGNQVISVVTLTSGGVVVPATNYYLRRSDDIDEPPYNYIELDRSKSSVFSAGTTSQRAIALTGLFGWNDTATSVGAGLLGGNITAAVTTVVINPNLNEFNISAGSLLLVGTERMVVIDSYMSSVGQNLAADLTAVQGDKIVTVSNGAAFAGGETILIGAERMRIDDIAGNNLIVSRAWDGTALSAHSLGAGSPIYALRTFTVARGVLGSTAATHSSADVVYVHKFPDLVTELTIAETIVMIEQASTGYARIVGSGPNAREATGKGLDDIREQAMQIYGRRNRTAAI